jgi:hypothetical protein
MWSRIYVLVDIGDNVFDFIYVCMYVEEIVEERVLEETVDGKGI